jgi:hypothetical protein
MKLDRGNSGGPLVDDQGRVVGVLSGVDFKTKLGYCTDVCEVRDFLRRAKTEQEPAKNRLPIVGSWTAIFEQSGKKGALCLTLNDDRTCLMQVGTQTHKGRYTYQDNTLSLTVPAFRERFTLHWTSPDSFTFTKQNLKFTLTRR